MARLTPFAVRLALPGLSHDQYEDLLTDLPDELRARPHLGDVGISWDPDAERLVLDIRDESFTADQAGKMLAEEIFEAACAVLRDTSGLRVEIMSVSPITH